LKATNFFPVVDVTLPDDMPAAVRINGAAIATMSGSSDANPGLLPVGLGDLGGKFSQVYKDTFERIVLAGQDVRAVLDDQANTLRSIMEESGAPCWAPDPPSDGPCPVLLPAIVLLCVFFLYPFFLVAWQALVNDSGELTTEYFSTMIGHWKFKDALTNTLLLTAIVVPIQTALALYMATLVIGMKKGRDMILYLWTIPLGISDLAAGIIWLAIFDQSGFLNSLLHSLGIIDQAVPFLGYQSKTTIFLAIALAEIWRATAIMLVILVAGIGLIPKEYYECSEVFGASRWKQFTRITLPLLKPSLQTALILRVILAFEVFAVVLALGGTNFPVLMGETYTWQFSLRDGDVAAAYALVILGVSILCTLVIMWVLRTPNEARI